MVLVLQASFGCKALTETLLNGVKIETNLYTTSHLTVLFFCLKLRFKTNLHWKNAALNKESYVYSMH